MKYQVEITPFRTELCSGDSGFAIHDLVVIKSKEGIDIGKIQNADIDEEDDAYGEIVRTVTQKDMEKRKELREYEEYCLLELRRAVEEYKFPMTPVYAHCQFDEERVIFYFTAQKRLNRRVVIKQIGTRDYSKLFGGIGPCGRNLCCRTFLSELKSISLRMARDQKLYVSPSKISGLCGRLLCCLNFEEDFYTDFSESDESLPAKNGDDDNEVTTP
jgi:cell fate regulator YaaT (PSP1 superfamily)